MPYLLNHSVIDELESELGIHYEISSGSALGAVKLGNYLPWDIDGELFVQAEKIHLLRPGRRGHDLLLREGEGNFFRQNVSSFGIYILHPRACNDYLAEEISYSGRV